MKHRNTLLTLTTLLLAPLATLHAADIELTETLQLPECHSIGWVNSWVKADPEVRGEGWDGVLDEAKWGTPSPQQLVVRNWDWRLTDEQWQQAVRERGEGKREEVKFNLWIPEGVDVVKGIVTISGHGSGEALYGHPNYAPALRAIARELHLAMFKFVGNPMQRGFWPKSLLYERLKAFGQRCGHPELEHAPLFLYGHSNGTGFSAIFPATESERVWAWVSMRPGITFQVYQPGAAQVPGLVIFGEDDHFLARPSKEENLAVVPLMRKKHKALWNFAVEPKTGHGPGQKTWPLVFSFLRHTFAARVPADADPREGPVTLNALSPESGYLGQNWDVAKGGYQDLPIAPYADFAGDKSTASWLVNAAYAADWQAFQRDGQVADRENSSPEAGYITDAFTLLTALLLVPQAELHGTDLAAPAAPSLGLSVQDGVLVRNERPYRGIGVNYFNAFGRVLADSSDTSYQQGFAVLREHDIPFARFAACGFWPSDWRLYQTNPTEYFRRLDGVIEAAEKNQIGLIPSLFWRWSTIAELVGEPHSAWENPASRTHALMRRYTEEFVTRYRKSPAIWGWEFANEMSLGVDLPNAKSLIAARKPIPRLGVPAPTDADIATVATLTTALTEFGKLVRRLDQDRIIISGNSAPRPSAWHNIAERSWTLDSREQFSEILLRDNPDPLSVLGVHWYPSHENRFSKEQPASLADVAEVMITTAQRARKPLFIGEFGDKRDRAGFTELLHTIEQAGVPLAALWVFDLKQQDKDWNITATNDRAYMLQAIADANRRLSTGIR